MKEKANKTSAAPYKVKGAVLFTVVCVMMVLIVFLMGTLALAATANNRAHSNYQKAQTEATARAVLDAAARAVQDDTAATGVRTSVVSGVGFDVQLGAGGEIYKVDVRDTGSDKSYYDENDKAWKLADVYELSVTIDKTKADTTYSAYVTAKTVTTPGSGGGGGGGGAFVSMGGTSTIGTGGYITGGTYVGIDPALPGPAAGYYTIADNEVFVDSPYYINGSATTGTGQGLGVHFTAPGDYFAVIGNFTESQANQFLTDYTGFNWAASGGTMDYSRTPYVYVDGVFTLHSNSSSKIGDATAPTNVYCGTLQASGKLETRGDVYTFEPGGDSSIGSSGYVPTLYKWASSEISTISNAPTATSIYGSWFSKGNIEMYCDGNEVQGDLRAEGNITLSGSGSLDVDGDIVSGGILTVNAGVTLNAKNIYAGTVINNGTIKCSGQIYTLNPVQGNEPESTISGKEKVWYEIKLVSPASIPSPGDYTVKVDLIRHRKFDDGSSISTSSNTLLSDVEFTNIHLNGAHEISNAVGDELKNRVVANGLVPNPVKNENDIRNNTTEASAAWVDKSVPATINIAAASDVPTLYGKAIYPTEYDKTNIKTTINLQTPQKTDYSSYYTNSSTFSSRGEEFIGASGLNKLKGNTLANFQDMGGYYLIKGACYFEDITFDKNVYIDPASDIRVMLKNCSMGSNKSIIANDAHEITLYVLGSFTIGNNGGIFTRWYWDQLTAQGLDGTYPPAHFSGNTMQIKQEHTDASDDDYPNLIINSDPGAEMHLTNMTIVTAMVRAPQMLFEQSQGTTGSYDIEYTNADGALIHYGSGANSQTLTSSFNKTKLDTTGLIGQLIAEEIQLDNSRNWGMIFVEIPSGTTLTTPPTPPSTTPFAGDSTILYYDYY